MDDIVVRLRDDPGVADVYEAADEIERLREAITMAANRLDVADDGGGDICAHCIDLARSYLAPFYKTNVTSDTPEVQYKQDQ